MRHLAQLPLDLLPLELRDLLTLAATCRQLRQLVHQRLGHGAAIDADLSLLPSASVPHALNFFGRRAPGKLRSLVVTAPRLRDAGALQPCLGPELRRLSLRMLSLPDNGSALANIGSSCPHLTSVNFRESGPIPRAFASGFTPDHPLRVLALYGSTFQGGSGSAFLSNLPPLASLKAFELGRPPGAREPPLEAGAVGHALLASRKGEAPYPALTTLGLERQSNLTTGDLTAIATALPSLKRLNLNDTLRDLSQAVEGVIAQVAQRCRHLEVLLLRWPPPHPGLTDQDATALAGAAPGLVALDISGHGALTDEGVLALARGCQRLRTLTLARQPHISPQGLQEVLRLCPTLATVEAVRCRRLHARALNAITKELAGRDGGAPRLLLDREGSAGVPTTNDPIPWANIPANAGADDV